MSQEAMEVVLDHLHARRHRDLQAVAATLAIDVVHEGVRPDLLCTGRDEVLANVELSMQADRVGIERLELIDAGPDHAVLGVAGPRFRDVAEPSPDGEVFLLFTVRNGRITRMRDFRARADAITAARSPSAAG